MLSSKFILDRIQKDIAVFFYQRRQPFLSLLLALVLLSGCGRDRYDQSLVLPQPLQAEQKQEQGKAQVLLPEGEQARWKKDGSTVFSATPSLATREAEPMVDSESGDKKVIFEGKPVSINFKDMPLPAFINSVYGDILNISFTLPPELNSRKDLVTLRSQAEISPTELYTLATEIIAQYGVQVTFANDLLTFTLADQRPEEIPLLVSGRTLPEVPITHRPIFQLVELAVVRNTMVAHWLQTAFAKQPLEILEDPERNAILLKGDFNLVKLAVEMIQVLDQPHMRGRHSLRVDPVFLEASVLATELTKILTAEGINVGDKGAAVILLPVVEINALLMFAPDQETIDHLRHWITSLDKPGEMISDGIGSSGIFSYQVKNTTAESIVTVLNQVLGKLESTQEGASSAPIASPASVLTGNEQAKKTGTQAEGKKSTKSPLASNGGIIVDAVRNSIVYQGSGAVWNQLLPVIHNMDQTDRMVLLEVIIAEITLDEGEELGINWSVMKGDVNYGTAALAGGDAGLAVGGSGFSFVLDTAGGIFSRLNAYASQKKLAILSTPRLMVKNGTEASIEVGKEVPFISRAVSSTNITAQDTAGIVSETQYRKTGILLSVKPTVFSGNRVELEVSQEASETTPDDTNTTSSPSIYNRKIDTSLTLNNGSSVLLGGLITTNRSNSWQGVPWLSTLPLFGPLFKVSGAKTSRTEMVMMIIPYIVDGDEEARSLTKAYLEHLSFKADERGESKGEASVPVEGQNTL